MHSRVSSITEDPRPRMTLEAALDHTGALAVLWRSGQVADRMRAIYGQVAQQCYARAPEVASRWCRKWMSTLGDAYAVLALHQCRHRAVKAVILDAIAWGRRGTPTGALSVRYFRDALRRALAQVTAADAAVLQPALARWVGGEEGTL